MPHFNSTIFFCKNAWVCQYFLKSEFSLIVVLNVFYKKFNLNNMLTFSKFILKTYSIHWFRVSFKGKGYRLRKFKKYNKVTLNFGHSHWAKIALRNSVFFFKKVRRQNYLCFSKNYYFYKQLKGGIKFFKKLNSYTKRGLRLKKQYIKKRFGKISQVVSSLH
jgi:hypothetical protein